MSLTEAIAVALKYSNNPVETVVDYLAEKDSRVTRAEAASLIRGFESQVGLLISSLQNGQPISSDTETVLVKAARLRATKAGWASLAEILAAELQKRSTQPIAR